MNNEQRARKVDSGSWPPMPAKLFCLSGLSLSVSAGLAHSVYPDITILPPLLGFISGFFVGAPYWLTLFRRQETNDEA